MNLRDEFHIKLKSSPGFMPYWTDRLDGEYTMVRTKDLWEYFKLGFKFGSTPIQLKDK